MSLEWGCQPISKENSLKASLVTEEHPFDPPAADRILGLGEGLGFGERGVSEQWGVGPAGVSVGSQCLFSHCLSSCGVFLFPHGL